MAILHSSAPISIYEDEREGYSSIRDFFGDIGTSSSLSEFYRNKDGIVPDNNVNQNCGPNNNGIPTVGTINLTDFLGATNEKYKLTASPNSVNEGGWQTITLYTRNVPKDDPVYYKIQGDIDVDDIVWPTGVTPTLLGNFTVGDTANGTWNASTLEGTHAITFQVKADLISDGGVIDGIPQVNHEDFEVLIYSDSARTIPIGGPEGVISCTVNDTSLSWYQNIENATVQDWGYWEISGQDTMSVTANEQGFTTQDYYVITACDNAFEVKTDNNAPTNYNITMITPRSGDKHTGTLKYGNAPASWIAAGNDYGRYITSSTGSTDSVNQNWDFLQGDSFTPATGTWSDNTTNPSLSMSRSAKFPQLTTVGTHVITIIEKLKFNLESLVSGDDRELGQQDTNSSGEGGTHWCLVKTTHILDVGEWSA